jgi:hypothetical protein
MFRLCFSKQAAGKPILCSFASASCFSHFSRWTCFPFSDLYFLGQEDNKNLKLFIRRFRRLRRYIKATKKILYSPQTSSTKHSRTFVFTANASSVFIRVHPRPIRFFVLRSAEGPFHRSPWPRVPRPAAESASADVPGFPFRRFLSARRIFFRKDPSSAGGEGSGR